MDQTQEKEQKWGGTIFILTILNANSIVFLLLRKALDLDDTSFKLHFISSAITLGLTFGIRYILPNQSWKVKLWTMYILAASWLLATVLFSVL
ncbi:hypothetical protein [Dyadobacter crusticola]|uniref:hypothetical protein n=1 Tax=Dyadobacter crusticola TaxID=292407 RepID=UPI0004E0EF86|nr:hypothetical protein [Dyadobacter crusticola]